MTHLNKSLIYNQFQFIIGGFGWVNGYENSLLMGVTYGKLPHHSYVDMKIRIEDL